MSLICDCTGEEERDFVRSVLEDKNYNMEDVVNELLDPQSKESYYLKYQAKKTQSKLKNNVLQVEDNCSISVMISENLEHISTLFQVLQLNDPQMNPKVW